MDKRTWYAVGQAIGIAIHPALHGDKDVFANRFVVKAAHVAPLTP
jgi:hypothetical protein